MAKDIKRTDEVERNGDGSSFSSPRRKLNRERCKTRASCNTETPSTASTSRVPPVECHGRHAPPIVGRALSISAMLSARDRRGKDPSRLWLSRKGGRGRRRVAGPGAGDHPISPRVCCCLVRLWPFRLLTFLIQTCPFIVFGPPVQSPDLLCRSLALTRPPSWSSAIRCHLCFSAHQRTRWSGRV
jgi:hypothetical protein